MDTKKQACEKLLSIAIERYGDNIVPCRSKTWIGTMHKVMGIWYLWANQGKTTVVVKEITK